MTATLDRTGLAAFVGSLRSHEVRVVSGIEPGAFADELAGGNPPKRPVLLFDLAVRDYGSETIDNAVAQLAGCIVDLWPFLWGGEDFSRARDDVLTSAHLPIRLGALASKIPGLSQTWACTAVSNLLHGLPPRVAGASAALEWAQLVLAFCPTGVTIAAAYGPGAVGEAWIRAVEWLAAQGEVAAVVLAGDGAEDAALQRVAFDGRHIVGSPSAVMATDCDKPSAEDGRPVILALPRNEGAPHPQSAVELRMYELVQADAELRPLLSFNKGVPAGALLDARADILWSDGRLVIEIDGPEHRQAANYRRDRHRDYKLTCAGYRILRITNEEVAEDAYLVLEKIRDVVRLAREDSR